MEHDNDADEWKRMFELKWKKAKLQKEVMLLCWMELKYNH